MTLLVVSLFIAIASVSCTRCSNLNYDLVVYRATPGGIAAAISAAEMGIRVMLMESSAHVGGMATEGGIGLRDSNNPYLRRDPRSSQHRWGQANARHYGMNRNVVWQPDNWVGEQSFLTLLNTAGVQLELNTNFVEGRKGLHMTKSTPRKILALQLENKTIITAKYFVDASYEGELMQASGVDFTWGRESADKYGEPWGGITNSSKATFPVQVNPLDELGNPLKFTEFNTPLTSLRIGSADENVMAYSYRVCLTNDPSLMVPIEQPLDYDSSNYELARRLVKFQRGPENQTLSAISEPWLFLDYMSYEKTRKAMKYDACCGTSPFGIDAVGLNVGYATASRKERETIAEQHRSYVHGLLWFWRSDPEIPDWIQREHASYGLCRDEWPDNGHFPRQMYVREAARMIGDHVFTQNDRTPQCRHDSIAVATWGLDIHEMQRVILKDEANDKMIVKNEGLWWSDAEDTFAYELPYWIILPKRQSMSNLAVINCPSASHVAFSGIRVEPTLWHLGMAAGTAAAIATTLALDSFHDVEIPLLQKALLEQGAVVHTGRNNKTSCEEDSLMDLTSCAKGREGFSRFLFGLDIIMTCVFLMLFSGASR